MMVSYWLITSDEWIKSLINKFSKEFNTPKFYPHITLISGLKISQKEALEFLKRLKKTFEPLDLKLVDIGFEEIFHKSFYFKIELTDELLSLRKRLEKYFNGYEFNSEFVPHLSLFYYRCSNEEKLRIKQELLRFLPYKVRFDSLGAIFESSPIKNPADVKKWEVVF